MAKIPVGKTVAYAYVFTFSNLGAIIGLIWIAMLIVTVIGFFAQSTYVDAMIAYETTKNAAVLPSAFMWLLLFVFVAFLGNAIMLVPVLQQALGTRQGQALYHFALGPPEWRMFGAYLAFLGVVLAMAVAAALVESVVLTGMKSVDPALASALAFLIGAVVICVALVIGLRLAFFIPAVTLLEEKIDLSRGWLLARGNTLRILAVFALILVPVMGVYLGVEAALFGPQSVLPAGGPEMSNIDRLREAREQLPLTEALGFLFHPLLVGLLAGAVAASYRALTASGVAPPTAEQQQR